MQLRRNTAAKPHRSPIPAAAVYVLSALFLVGLCFSTFLLIVVHNALFFVLLLCISTLIAAFLLWNSQNDAVSFFLHSFPDSDINLATHGQLVKISGRHSTDFYVTDMKSGIKALVKAGPGSKVIPLIVESRLIKTSKRCRVLSSDFRKWLTERKVSDEARSLCLQEGYVKEGSFVSVVRILLKNDDVVMIVEPHEIVSTGCQWRKLLLPVDIEGLVIGSRDTTIMHCP